MGAVIYSLCALTAACCAWLLLRAFRASGARLLLWSSLSFIGWALNNALVFMDLVVLPEIDLSIFRTTMSLIAVTLMLYGLVWDVG